MKRCQVLFTTSLYDCSLLAYCKFKVAHDKELGSFTATDLNQGFPLRGDGGDVSSVGARTRLACVLSDVLCSVSACDVALAPLVCQSQCSQPPTMAP